MIMLEYSNMMPFNQFGGICVTRFLDFETLGYNQTFSKSLDFKVFSFDQIFSKSLEVKSCLLE